MLISAKTVGRIFVLCVFIASFCFKSGETITCHVCNSFTEPSCDDPFDRDNAKSLIDCEDAGYPKNSFCQKIDQKVQGDSRIIRKCAFEKEPRYECYFTGSETFRTYVCHCLGDGCNGSTHSSHNALLITLSLSAFIIFYFTTRHAIE